VVSRQFQEFRRQRGGRWRPSAAALRLGPPAGDLEALVYRDGYRLEQAGETLRTSGRTDLSDVQLARLLAQLPVRGPLRPVELAAEPEMGADEGSFGADAGVLAAEAEALRGRVLAALGRVMDAVDPEDLMIVRMHFAEGRTLAYVARALGLEQKPLYRRVERLRKQIRTLLEAEGVEDHDIREMLSDRRDP
jgi:RNA polymerase sigma factor for flagellar operon FliA